MTLVKVATAGTGYFSQFHYRAWNRLPSVRLVGICNRDIQKALGFAERYGIEAAFSNIAEMLKTAGPDLLDVITPPETHLAAVSAASEAGVDVICQKPFCRSQDEASKAISIADEAGITVVVHENFRFQPWYQKIKLLLGEDVLGQVYQATFRLRPGDGQGKEAYLDRQPYFQKMPRFLVHETAIHLIDVFRFLFGEPESVYSELRTLNPAISGEDAGIIIMRMKNGITAVFDGNRLSDHRARNRRLTMGEMTIEGQKGEIRLNGDGKLFFRAHNSNDESEIIYDWNDRDFGGDCVYGLQKHVVDARLGCSVIANTARKYMLNISIEEAVYASDSEGKRVHI
jgi:predicted dehydrogenase